MFKDTRQIDFSTLLGIILTLLVMTLAIFMDGGNILGFLQPTAMLIVIGGTFLVTTACFSFHDMWEVFPVTFKSIFYQASEHKDAAMNALNVAENIRKKGVTIIEGNVRLTNSKFFASGLQLVADGMLPEQIERIMHDEIASTFDRFSKVISILRKSAELSPAMGLIGTLIGLVQMLSHLTDISKIGPSMAIALLTTFYGALISYVIFYPLASKLERNAKEELLCYRIFLKALISMSKKENPRQLEIGINSLLAPQHKVSFYN